MIDFNIKNQTNRHVLSMGDINKYNESNAQADLSIFSKVNANETVADKNIEILNEKLANVNDNNGCFSTLWNDVKNATATGVSDAKCNEVIEAYKKGEIEFEEADEKIKEYSMKQDESLNLFSNIAASVSALGVTALAASAIAATGGAATPFVLALIGAGTGAITKAGFKLIDRASNNIDNDALDTKQIAQDGLSGAVAGGIATVTMGTAASAPNFTSAVISCGKTGVKTGAVSCGSNYAIDCVFDDNKKFKPEEFVKTTAEGVVVGGTVGAVMGGANSLMHTTGFLKSGCSFDKFVENAGTTSSKDVAANSVCTAEYKILNDRIRGAFA